MAISGNEVLGVDNTWEYLSEFELELLQHLGKRLEECLVEETEVIKAIVTHKYRSFGF